MTLSRSYQLALLCACSLWVLSFAAKGALFQLGLYLTPLLVLASRPGRELVLGPLRPVVLACALGLLLMPMISELVAAFSGYQFKGQLFEIFWRLVLFPAALIAAVYLGGASLRKCLYWLLSVTTLYAICGILGDVGVTAFERFDTQMRGAVANPNPFGAWLGVGVLVSGFLIIQCRSRIAQIGLFLLLILHGYCMYQAQARGAWLGTLAGLGVLGLYYRHIAWQLLVKLPRAFKWGLAGVVVLTGLVLIQWLISYIDSPRVVYSVGIRLQLWPHFWEQLSGHELLGQPLDLYTPFSHANSPHNSFLTALLIGGWPGLVAFLSLLIFCVYRICQSRSDNALLGGAILALVCVYFSFNSELYSSEVSQGIFAIALALWGIELVSGEEQHLTGDRTS